MKFSKRTLVASLLASLFSVGCANPGSSVADQKVDPILLAETQSEIEKILARPEVGAAMASIESMNARNIERLIALTEIAAPPFQETARATDLVKRMKALGLADVTMDEVGNVIARRAGRIGDRTVAIVAHIDTVFPVETDVRVRRKGNVYHAPGVGDNSRGLVVLLSLAEVITAHKIQPDANILFVGSVGEEGLGDLRGVRHLFRQGAPAIDSFIAIDGGDANRIVLKGVGSNRYRVTFRGPGGHSYGAFGRAHPHQALANAIADFTAAARSITKRKPKASFSVGRIGGGTSINSIPFESWMEVDMRSVDETKLSQLDAAFKKAVNEALAAENQTHLRGEDLTVEIVSVGQRPPGQSDSNSNGT